MKIIEAIVIDDEPTAIENMEYLLADIPGIRVQKTFTSPAKALDWLLENQTNLIFLDVEMPKMTGFEFLEELKKYPDNPCIIFTTGFAEYAIDAIKAPVYDYLFKPISREELRGTLQRYRLKCLNDAYSNKPQFSIQQTGSPQKIVFAHHRGFVAYAPDEIIFIEADRNYSNIHPANGNKQIVSSQLGQIGKAIPKTHFFRISRSIIINLTWFTHADQKLKKCYLEYIGNEFDFPIKVAKIKELIKVMMG